MLAASTEVTSVRVTTGEAPADLVAGSQLPARSPGFDVVLREQQSGTMPLAPGAAILPSPPGPVVIPALSVPPQTATPLVGVTAARASAGGGDVGAARLEHTAAGAEVNAVGLEARAAGHAARTGPSAGSFASALPLPLTPVARPAGRPSANPAIGPQHDAQTLATAAVDPNAAQQTLPELSPATVRPPEARNVSTRMGRADAGGAPAPKPAPSTSVRGPAAVALATPSGAVAASATTFAPAVRGPAGGAVAAPMPALESVRRVDAHAEAAAAGPAPGTASTAPAAAPPNRLAPQQVPTSRARGVGRQSPSDTSPLTTRASSPPPLPSPESPHVASDTGAFASSGSSSLTPGPRDLPSTREPETEPVSAPGQSSAQPSALPAVVQDSVRAPSLADESEPAEGTPAATAGSDERSDATTRPRGPGGARVDVRAPLPSTPLETKAPKRAASVEGEDWSPAREPHAASASAQRVAVVNEENDSDSAPHVRATQVTGTPRLAPELALQPAVTAGSWAPAATTPAREPPLAPEDTPLVAAGDGSPTLPSIMAGPAGQAGDAALTPTNRVSVEGMTVERHEGTPSAATSAPTLTVSLTHQSVRGEIDVPDLGRIVVSTRARDGGVDVLVTAARPGSAATLLPHAIAMQSEVKAANVPLRRFDISAGDFGYGQQRSGEEQAHTNARMADEEPAVAPIESSTTAPSGTPKTVPSSRVRIVL